jgi:hypothetical protein
MRIVKIQGHHRTIELPITNEEYDLLNKFKSRDTALSRRDLTEREVHVANLLVIKDVLYRKNQDGNITYKKKTLEE